MEADQKEVGLLNRIRQQIPKMSKGQKRIAQYILEHYDKAAFLTALELAGATGVSESTAVRFATSLGLSGYPQFQKELEQVVTDKLHCLGKIEITDSNMPQTMVLDHVMNADAQKIKMTLQDIDRNAFDVAVDDILAAQHVYIVGIRNSAPLASFFFHNLNLVRNDVIQIQASNDNELFEQIFHITQNDVLIGISFPPYSMRTLKSMEFANNRNAHVIAITDSKHSPMNLYSACNLFAISDMASIADSLVAPMSLINALIVALCLRKSDEVVEHLENLEQVIADYQYEGNDEINLPDEDIEALLRKI